MNYVYNKYQLNLSSFILFIVIFLTSITGSFESNTRIIILSINYGFLLLAFRNIKNLKIDKTVMFFIISLIVSLVFNIEEITNYFSIIFIVTASSVVLVGQDKSKSFRIILYAILVYILIILALMTVMPKAVYRPKVIGSLELQRVGYGFINFSTLGFLTGYSYFLSNYINNKVVRRGIKILMLGIPFFIGKLSVILSILLIVFLRKFYWVFSNSTVRFISLLLLFLSSAIGYVLFSYLSDNLEFLFLFTGRAGLWVDYIDYLLNFDLIHSLFGYGFFSENKVISFLPHPHNQYLSTLFTGGVLLTISYFSILSKVFKNNIKEERSLDLFIFILLIQVADDYFILTAYPLTFILLVNLLKKDNI